MLIKTHLAITVFFVLLFLPVVNHDIVFVIVALVATFLPDVDSRHSTLGRKWWNRILQFFTKHRGVIHSFSFLLVISVIFALFIPILALGFFLGYGLHLLGDSFTQGGISPFWPFRKMSSGGLRTGGKVEKLILTLFVILDALLILLRVL